MVRVNKLGDPAAWLDGVIKAYNDWRNNHYTGHVCDSILIHTGKATKRTTGDNRDRNLESILGLEQRHLEKGGIQHRPASLLGYRDEKISECLRRYRVYW